MRAKSGESGVLVGQMMARLHAQQSFENAVLVILNDAVALHGAELGNVQLAVDDHVVIVAQRGFRAPFLQTFRRVHADSGSCCGRVLRERRTVVIRDVELDEECAPYLPVLRAAGTRSVTSTPLLTGNGLLMGVVSTHFVNVHEPTPIELKTLHSYGTVAADHLQNLLADEPLKEKVLSISRRLYDSIAA